MPTAARTTASAPTVRRGCAARADRRDTGNGLRRGGTGHGRRRRLAGSDPSGLTTGRCRGSRSFSAGTARNLSRSYRFLSAPRRRAHRTSLRLNRHKPTTTGSSTQSATDVPTRAHSPLLSARSLTCAIVRLWSSHLATPSSAWIDPIAPHAVGRTKYRTIDGAEERKPAPKPTPATIASATASAFWPKSAADHDHVSSEPAPKTAVPTPAATRQSA